ncbi:MAG: ABC transporter ATP-binding protein [Bacteroidota bacterium]
MNIEVKNISYAYKGNIVFDDTSFSLHPNRIYGLIGENGAGKTTLISMLANILKPQSGEITNINRVGLLLQGVGFYQNLSVTENLELFASEKGLKANRIEELLELTGFPVDQPQKNYKKLSQGYKQRLAIIQSFLTDGNLVLLDEPFSTVDLPTVRVLKKSIKRFVATTQKTVLISSHQLKEVSDLLDETLLIKAQKVISFKTDYDSEQRLVYLSCPKSESVSQFLEVKSEVKVKRAIDDTLELELHEGFKVSQLVRELEEKNIHWTKLERKPPLEFLFYQK